jgi:rubrerythrin
MTEKDQGTICPTCNQTYWKCADCGATFTADAPPGACPSCKAQCEFKNVTCYLPDCGGSGNIDPRL